VRFLVEHSGYRLKNVGDAAMLQAGVARIRDRWPDATVEVFTLDSARLAEVVPDSVPREAEIAGRNLFFEPWLLVGALHKLFPGPAKRVPTAFESFVRRTWPRFAAKRAAGRLNGRAAESASMWDYFNAIEQADAVLSTGGGFFTDRFGGHAFQVAFTLMLAQRYGKPTALFGQGIGPVDHNYVRRSLVSAAPNADLIALREGLLGPTALGEVGVARERIFVTGDDAVEIAYARRPHQLGDRLGVNVRKASYSEVGGEQLVHLRSALSDAVSAFETTLVPVPISWYDVESEMDTIREITADLPSEGWDAPELDTTAGIVRQIATCRVVVTGSYHAGVFALSQGIPVVGLAKSDYYRHKFLGLADQFGEGCAVVSLNDAAFGREIVDAVRAAWRDADALRPQLLAAAEDQVARSRAAYTRFFAIVERRAAQAEVDV